MAFFCKGNNIISARKFPVPSGAGNSLRP